MTANRLGVASRNKEIPKYCVGLRGRRKRLGMGLKQRFNIVLIGMMKAVERIAILGLMCAALSLSADAQAVVATVAAGTNPQAVAVNPVTNKIYVANYNYTTNGNSNVTVIDGATNSATTVAVGPNPDAVAVNPNTNMIYVANGNSSSGTVTVIDGATNNTTTIAAGGDPIAFAVNAVTNQIYVANFSSQTVTVIDGATNNTTTVAVGDGPWAVAVNPNTNSDIRRELRKQQRDRN
jgi:YVTN family beta-propeller protein